MANIALPQSSLAITGDAFHHFRLVQHTTFKTEALRLVSNEGRLKRLLLLYKGLLQPYLSLFWL